MLKAYDLPCLDARKSFYGKAKVIMEENRVLLKSYNTIVGYISEGKFHRTWNGYSQTTVRHVSSFCEMYGLDTVNKAKWDAMEVESVA